MVHVVSIAADTKAAARRADEAAQFLRFFNITAQAHPLATSTAEAEIILQKAAQLDARMLVMGAFGRSRFSEVLGRSTTSVLLGDRGRLLFCHH